VGESKRCQSYLMLVTVSLTRTHIQRCTGRDSGRISVRCCGQLFLVGTTAGAETILYLQAEERSRHLYPRIAIETDTMSLCCEEWGSRRLLRRVKR
jgi:hypothetical protein